MRIGLIALLVAIPIPATGQSAWLDAATRATGGAGIALESPVPYPFNPASLSEHASVSAGMSRLFGIAELAPQRVGLGTTLAGIRWAASATGLNIEGFTDTRLGVCGAAAVGGGSIGARGVIIRRRAGPYPAARSFLVTAGFRHALSARVSAAVVLARGVGRGLPDDEAPLLALGAAWSDGRLAVPVDIRRSGGAPPSLHAGIHLAASDTFILRVGASTAPDLVAGGVSMVLGRLAIDVGIDRHVDLGLSLSLDVRWLTG